PLAPRQLHSVALVSMLMLTLGAAAGAANADAPAPTIDACVPNGSGDRQGGGGRAVFDLKFPGIQSSVWPDGSVALLVPITTVSERFVPAVQITRVSVVKGSVVEPTSFPLVLGDMDAEQMKIVDMRVTVRKLQGVAGLPRRARRLSFNIYGRYTT